MRLLLDEEFHANWWIAQTIPKIPLGVSLVDGMQKTIWMRYPIFEGQMISDTILVCGGTGSGKSVLAKLVTWFIAQRRPVIVFDWAGQDSHLMHEPNSRPVNLPPHTRPSGLTGHYLYYPLKTARLKAEYERLIMPNLSKYNGEQLEALGFSTGAAKYLKNILKRYGPFKNMEVLYEFVEKFPTDENESKRIRKKLQEGKMHLKHGRIYKENDTIMRNSKDSLKKILPALLEKEIFSLDNRREFPFEEAFLRGDNIIFSFNDKVVGRIEINYYMAKIEELRKKHPESPRYFISIEEAHKVLGDGKANAKGGSKIDEIIDDFVLVCRKLSVGLILIMPEVINLSGKVLNDMKEIITGKFKGDNANKLIAAMGRDQRSWVIPYLKFNRFAGAAGREMLFYNQDYNSIFRFQPYNAPCEIHREVTK